MAETDDRRKRVRVPVKSTIRHSQYQVLGTPVFQENSAIDLSSGGISFETAREYKIGNLVLLEVQFNEELLKILVCVAWVKKVKAGSFQVGAELIAVDPVDKRKMQKHLNQMIHALKASKKTRQLTAQKKGVKKKTVKKSTAKKKLAKKKTAKKRPVKKKINRGK